MSKKYTFTMVVVKPTGKGGKPLKPKPIKPKPQQKAGGGMSNKPKNPKIVRLMPKGVFYKGKAKDYPGIKELIKRKNKKALGGEMLKNPKKADLDKDGKLSGYEKKRGMAIEQNMKPKKANLGMLMMKKAKDKGAKGAEFLSPLAMLRRATRKEGGMMKYSDGGFSSTQQKGNIVKGKLKSQKELKKITDSDEYKKSDYQTKTKMLNVATQSKGGEMKRGYGAARTSGMGLQDENLVPGKTMDYYKDLM